MTADGSARSAGNSRALAPRPRVVVSRLLPEPAIALLRQAFELAVLDVGDDERAAALRRELRDADGLVCCVSESIDEELLASAPQLKVVANVAVGYDNIDVAAASRRDVVVTNTPEVLSETTAEFALALMLAVLRRVAEADRFVRAGKWQGWDPQLLVGDDLGGSTVGIVGLGRIGKALAHRLRHGFGCSILYTARRTNEDARRELGAQRVSKEELLASSDVVSLHLPLDPTTRQWLDADGFERMRRGSVLVNTARGGVLDEAALVRALESGRLSGAGLDVFESEPRVHPGLLRNPRVVLAPHIGSASHRTRERMALLAVRNVRAVLEGKAPLTPVVTSRAAGEGR